MVTRELQQRHFFFYIIWTKKDGSQANIITAILLSQEKKSWEQSMTLREPCNRSGLIYIIFSIYKCKKN
jgi:hypothetical protein